MLRYFIQTYGCQMNEADSETMARLLEQAGFEAAHSPEDASFILLNTCCVRDKPEQKVYSRLGELRPIKEQRPETIIAVAGCMAQKEGENLLRRVPYLDMVIGSRQFHRLEEFIHSCRRGGQRICALGMEDDPCLARYDLAAQIKTGASLKAFVPIILGCENYCTYCVVPSVRGREKSRPAAQIKAEIQALAGRGCREITLLGQNVLAYGRDLSESSDFVSLLEHLQRIEGIKRIRFTTSHPRDVDDRLIEAVAQLPAVCEHLHLPIQAGHDRLLKAMGRGYTASYYLEMMEKIRGRIPDVAITTDIMVGFPGETEEEFEASLQVYEQIGFDQAFTFAYSPRPGTPAARLPDQVPQKEKAARLNRLIELTNETALRINRSQVGRQGEVLVAGASEKDSSRLAGRLRNNKLVVFPGPVNLIGRFAQVSLTAARQWGFSGELSPE
jgi:tRNA-2-methylthio-N6-dimethylallyladenosine synthase